MSGFWFLRRQGCWRPLLGVSLVGALLITVASCKHRRDESDDALSPADAFAPVTPLTSEDVTAIVTRAAQALDAPSLIVAVVDRVGNILGVWRRDGATTDDELNYAVAIARSAAFLSSSQGPLSSRTLEHISTFHFPPTFGDVVPSSFPSLVPQRATTGVRNTPQGPLWQILASNRGAPLALCPPVDPGDELTSAETGFETVFNDGMCLPPACKIDGSCPGPGLGYLPGGVPLYKGGRIVGGVGCYGPPPDACEFASLEGAGDFALRTIPDEGAIFLVGVLLPYLSQTRRPTGFLPGVYDPAGIVVTSTAGEIDPFGDLIGPRADPLGLLGLEDVERIVQQGIDAANGTRAAIRLPLGTTTKMVFAVTNLDGLILALHRMEDAPIFSVDVSVAKARTVVYYSGPDLHPADAIPGLPAQTATTTRTLGFTSQPRFPPTIDNSDIVGPLYDVALQNQDPAQYNRLGRAPFLDGLQNGLNFFPGSAPLYNAAGELIGGLAVSGDGVEQDDFVTKHAAEGYEAPPEIRADHFSFEGVKLPYFKFPQLPGTGE